jgi:dimethylargininase
VPVIALTKPVPPSINTCELTHLARAPIDVERARSQHRSYEETLERLGCTIERLPMEADNPDSVFVEDCALVLPEIAIITRPGAPSRRGEVASVAAALRKYRSLAEITAPATIDGGDVLVLGKNVFVGISSRTDRDAVRQLRNLVATFGYSIEPVTVAGCLHLKSAVTQIGDDTVLLNRQWVDPGCFGEFEVIDVLEPDAANALVVAGTVIVAAAFPRTREHLERRGFDVEVLDASELAKAEGALTCCSVIVS